MAQPSLVTAVTTTNGAAPPERIPNGGAAVVETGLYAPDRKIYPRAVTGWFAAWRWVLVWATQLAFYGGAWLTWNDRQAVLFDIVHRKFYIFGLVFWPQDIVYLTVLLIVSALSLFLFTAVAGRLWCGYACPQTVYTEIFLWIERVIEGGRVQRMKLDRGSASPRKIALKSAKHAVWIVLALWTGFTFVGYVTPIRELWTEVMSLSTGPWETFWMLFYGFATYGNAGWMREQVCIYMCPYARFQSAMFDKDTLIIAYDPERGEPRGPRAKAADYRARGLGDCVDCSICVQVCPTGIDIRDGLQYQCIGCAACVDGCDQVMDKMGYPRGLIRYSTQHAVERNLTYAQMLARAFRPRVLVYTAILWSVIIAAATVLWLRVPKGGRDPRPGGHRARGRGRQDRERLPAADHEHRRDRACLRNRRRRPADAPRGGPIPGRAGSGLEPDGSRAIAGGVRRGATRHPQDRFHRARRGRRGRGGARKIRLHREVIMRGQSNFSMGQQKIPAEGIGKVTLTPHQPWYREPWPWILMAGPAAVIVAGAVTIWLAVSSSDGLVADDYYKRGLAINQELRRDQAALNLGISAGIEARGGVLRVRLTARGAAPEALFAELVHATRAGHDQRLRLPRVAPGIYETGLPELPAGRWRIVLEDPRGEWRLTPTLTLPLAEGAGKGEGKEGL